VYPEGCVLLGSLGHEVHEAMDEVDDHVHAVHDRAIHRRDSTARSGHGTGPLTLDTRIAMGAILANATTRQGRTQAATPEIELRGEA
jgi:hypothetical protein